MDSVELIRREDIFHSVTTRPQFLVSWPNPWEVGTTQCEMRPSTTIDGDRFSLRAATFCFACSQEYDDELGDFQPRSDGDFLNSLVEEGVWVPTRPRTV